MAAVWTQKGTRSMQAVQQLTEAPPGTANEGVDLQDVASIAPILHAPAGQTFTGAGLLLGYIYAAPMWVRFPRADYDLTELAGLQDAALPTFEVKSPRGRFALIASGVVLSGAGAQISIEFLCITRQGLGSAD